MRRSARMFALCVLAVAMFLTINPISAAPVSPDINGEWDVICNLPDGSIAHMVWDIVQVGDYSARVIMDEYGVFTVMMHYYSGILWAEGWIGHVGIGANTMRGYRIIPRPDKPWQADIVTWLATRVR